MKIDIFLIIAFYLGLIYPQFIALFKDYWKNKKDYALITYLALIDRIGNMLSFGNWYATISARLGYLSSFRRIKLYHPLRRAVDYVFEPLDGEQHCLQAYEWLVNNRPYNDINRGGVLGYIILNMIVFPVLALIMFPICAIRYFGERGE